MRRYFYENTRETVMDFGTFVKLSANTIDNTLRKNANKRKALKNK